MRGLFELAQPLIGPGGSDVQANTGRSGAVATACLEETGGFGILRSVAVDQEVRGLGAGMLAVAAALREARSRRLQRVFLFTQTAGGFFERMGFVSVDRNDLPESVRSSHQALEECAASATAMVRDDTSGSSSG